MPEDNTEADEELFLDEEENLSGFVTSDSMNLSIMDTSDNKIFYPFVAIVGQETLKKAIILNVINPEIGGVLIRGEKGTAKSIAVRGLVDILPKIKVVKGCRFNCDPNIPEKYCFECKIRAENNEIVPEYRPVSIVDVPLNITEDRLVGSIDIEKVLTEGKKSFEPGILAKAHRNILYIDEINLLEDNIIDALIDVAAMGVVIIEREAISMSYPSEFILIGSMNPEEGELRPQLLDRLALQVEVKGLDNVKDRVEVMKRSREFLEDPLGFRQKFAEEERKLRERIIKARERLKDVTTPPRMMALISRIGIDFNIDGHRGDIIMEKTARTHAAYEGRLEVDVGDVIVAAELALPHRMRKQPFEEEEFSSAMLRRLVDSYIEEGI